MPDDMIPQLQRIRDVVDAFNIAVYIKPGYEADDLVGTAVRQAEALGLESYMVTPDKDYIQLVTENTFLVKPGRSTDEAQIIDVARVKDDMGFAPTQMIDYLALVGDSSDDIPGVAGIGPKSATPLIQQFGSVEGIYKNIDKIEKRGIPINIIFIFSILLIGYNDDWWFEKFPALPITKVELDADKTRILIPYLGSRNELVKIINDDKIKSYWIRKHGKGSENPSNYSTIPFTLEETNKLYNELVTKINTTFFPDNIIYSAEDIERAFEKKAKNPPDFSTFPTEVEKHLLADSIRKDVFKPFNYFVPDTLNKIINIVDDNKYANQLILIINETLLSN